MGAAGVRVAPVCGVVLVAPGGKMVSAGWVATMPVVITAWEVMGASIGWRMAQAAAVAERRV